MTDPTPRPPAGADLAPCPDCGGDLTATVGEDSDGQWWDLDCAGPLDPKGCGWCAYKVEDLAPFTLAGAPWTRALWAEVERLRAAKGVRRPLLAWSTILRGWQLSPPDGSTGAVYTVNSRECVFYGPGGSRRDAGVSSRAVWTRACGSMGEAIRSAVEHAWDHGYEVAPLWNDTESLIADLDTARAEVERLRAEAAELRLELAAEQGRQEGAPSAGWEYDPSEHSWRRYTTGRGWSCVYRDRNSTDGISEWGSDSNRGAPAPTMRAAMKAADEAEAQAAAKEPTP